MTGYDVEGQLVWAAFAPSRIVLTADTVELLGGEEDGLHYEHLGGLSVRDEKGQVTDRLGWIITPAFAKAFGLGSLSRPSGGSRFDGIFTPFMSWYFGVQCHLASPSRATRIEYGPALRPIFLLDIARPTYTDLKVGPDHLHAVVRWPVSIPTTLRFPYQQRCKLAMFESFCCSRVGGPKLVDGRLENLSFIDISIMTSVVLA
ncbi:hypothetical protein PQX77_012725 [Marasmius sp. AFHP31]|nr:hypothetical protein PQX77_012725 [Marasmius sp. AFHP31]